VLHVSVQQTIIGHYITEILKTSIHLQHALLAPEILLVYRYLLK